MLLVSWNGEVNMLTSNACSTILQFDVEQSSGFFTRIL